MADPRFHAFVAPARAYPGLGRLLAGTLLIINIYALVTVLILGLLWLLSKRDANMIWLEDALAADTPFSMFMLLATFLGMALGPMVAARAIHKRGAGTLFGPAARTLRHFAIGLGIAGGIMGLAVLVSFQVNAPLPGLSFGTWILILPIALIAIAIQTGAEELLFRGYLQQQLAARFASPVIWAVLPALIFGLLHFDPATAGGNVWLVVGSAGLFGLMAADLTARSGSIGAAWGFHLANNMFALTVIATQGTLTGFALYLTPYDISDTEAIRALIPVDLGLMVLTWFLIRRAVAHR